MAVNGLNPFSVPGKPESCKIRARDKGIPFVRDNPFCCQTTRYHSQGFHRTTSQKSIMDLPKYVLCFCVWCRLIRQNLWVLKQYGRGCASCEIVRHATFYVLKFRQINHFAIWWAKLLKSIQIDAEQILQYFIDINPCYAEPCAGDHFSLEEK